MDASFSTLTALAVFASTVEHGAVRSVHGYKVVGRKAGTGWVKWEQWVERGFVLAADDCREVGVPEDAPRILMQPGLHDRPAFREGHVVGEWLCIVAFDSVAGVEPSSLPPPMLSPYGNPQLECLPNLYKDLDTVFQFGTVEDLPQLIPSGSEEQQQTIHSGEVREHITDVADNASESESDENPQSGTELLPSVQKRQRTKSGHVRSITLAEIAQCFHLPLTEASKTLKIGVSILKKKCREYGIPRWPHRKIKSLDSLITEAERLHMGGQIGQDVRQEEKRALLTRVLTKRKRLLEIEKETIQQKPTLDLKTRTKKFREEVFKRRNRIKNANRD